MATAKRSYEYTRYYNSLLGLDLTERPSASSSMRMSSMENMYRDYYGNDGSAIETVPGFRKLFTFTFEDAGRRINAIHHFTPKGADKELLVVHAGRSLYKVPLKERDESVPELVPLTYYIDGHEIKEENPLANRKSHMFEDNGRLFILDGEDYFCLEGDSLRRVRDIAYIPTIFSDGEAYEQRNMLTDQFRIVYNLQNNIDSLLRYESGSTDLVYRITGESTCSVEGLVAAQTNIYIPSRAEIDGRSYEVEGISNYAFKDNPYLTEVKIGEGVKTVGQFSFYNCPALKTVILPNSIEKLGIGAFMSCTSLNSIVIGSSLSSIHASCFYGSGLSRVYFTSSEDEWKKIEKNSDDTVLSKVSIVFQYHEKSGSFIFYLNEKCQEISETSLNGAILTTDGKDISYTPLYEGDYIYAILINTTDVNLLFSRKLIILGRGYSHDGDKNEHALIPDLSENSYGIISECRMTCAFDGRIFFSGNPKFPSTVFYSSRGDEGYNLPEYIGELNHFSVGRTESEISSLLANGEELVIFKKDNERGGIYIHTPADASSDLLPRIYPVKESLVGVGALGGACKLYDDTVFLSERGLDALTRRSLTSELTVSHRSSNIDLALLKNAKKSASLCRWLGYLVIAIGGEFFLADSNRTFKGENSNLEYEWYRLNGIGTYLGQYAKFDYCPIRKELEGLSVLYDGLYLEIEEKKDKSLEDSRDVKSGFAYEDAENGYEETQAFVYYVVEKDEEGIPHCYLCDSDGEMTGGEFYPASVVYGAGELLFFGTESGDLCCFNNDKRDENGDIDIGYYTFNGRRYTSALVTLYDNCGISSLTKSTKRRSLCVRLKSFGRGKIKVGVHTGRSGWRGVAETDSSVFAFDDLAFDSFTFNTSKRITLPLSEKEKRWVEKQYRIFSDEYKRPFGIFELSYRYKVAGRIKE